MDVELKGKTALVFAASQGLGKAIAARLAEEGANVMIASRSEEKLIQVAEEISYLGSGQVLHKTADVTKTQDIQDVIQYTVDTFGTIDILINNTGGPKAGNFLSLTDDDWKHAFELNLLSYIRIIREVVPVMKKSGGRIVNIASSSIKEPIAGLILSNTFRTGIVGLTKTLASELAEDGILINTVAPGRIATDRVKELDTIRGEKLGVDVSEIEEEMRNQIPLKRYGQPEEFAKAVAFFVSGANSYMTGQSFLIDGGMVKSI
ncbi:SDR family oxidoreductase [Priestia megaterium]|uniref:SDR family oxidoreductase n=1 Tax=Priestia megaterium TaxID=1404 RepID=UPI00203E00A9|nr:SDR family oxidoreductase [Priestia megaterium]MCM3544757.1 SDR family oxidoreductase [Priestia megaterium]MDI3092212.1 SDR family oxidoreductase [Priestia megaterium]